MFWLRNEILNFWLRKRDNFFVCQQPNLLYSGNPLTSIFANSEDPDEMQHNAAFHQGLHSICKGKKDLQEKKTIYLENNDLTPLGMHNGLSQLYYIKQEGRIH